MIERIEIESGKKKANWEVMNLKMDLREKVE
jgi:hypothetical protein